LRSAQWSWPITCADWLPSGAVPIPFVFEYGLDAAKKRFTAVASELNLEVPKELAQ
jgi:hypothetical protein